MTKLRFKLSHILKAVIIIAANMWFIRERVLPIRIHVNMLLVTAVGLPLLWVLLTFTLFMRSPKRDRVIVILLLLPCLVAIGFLGMIAPGEISALRNKGFTVDTIIICVFLITLVPGAGFLVRMLIKHLRTKSDPKIKSPNPEPTHD